MPIARFRRSAPWNATWTATWTAALSVISTLGLSSALPAADPLTAAACVNVRTFSNEPVVGRLFALEPQDKIGFALLPSGELAVRELRELQPTHRTFAPATFDDLGKELTRENFPGFKFAHTKRYLYVYNCSDKFRVLTSKILETMYSPLEQYFKRAKVETQTPEFPMVVVIFATHQEMRRYKEIPESIVAFYEPLSNRVVLSERSRLVDEFPEMGIPQAFGTIAHEGVHQILHNIGVQQRLSRWPAWISEGLAEYFAPCDVSSSGTWKGVGKRNDMRMLELTQLPAPVEGRMTITEQTVTARQLTSTGYATAWALTHFLAENRRPEFMAYLKDVAQLKPLEVTDPQADLERFKKHFGQDLFKLEVGVHRHILKLQTRRQ